ncbi:MAG TPA: ribonuclease D [Chthoniobacterales bacterium]|nr:ribonuclease D [Chthoniobacterales bacterium]
MIANASQLRELLPQLESVDRVAIDTEADSLHCYREKLCLLQISIPGHDFIIDPLAEDVAEPAAGGQPLHSEERDRSRNANRRSWAIQPVQRTGCPPGAKRIDLAPLRDALAEKEIVLHGADYDLRLLRRNLNFVPQRIFDTVIAARLIGIREFSLAALVQRYFGIELAKGSQKANWAQRPLSSRMAEYAINDTRYLLPLTERLEAEMESRNRMEWFRQSCQRALEQAAIDRERDVDEAWRISGAGVLHGRASAVLRELWNWREKEAEAADRPPFHILQNRELLHSAEKFAAGDSADYKHFSDRRRRAFRQAAERGMQLPEKDWPVRLRRSGTRATAEVVKRIEQLRRNRDHAAKDLHIESSFIAPRAAVEAIAADQSCVEALLVPWQRNLLKL